MTALNVAGEATEVESEGSGRAARVRCTCDRCGTHVIASRSWRLTGSCENCGGFALTPLEPAGDTELVTVSRSTVGERLAREIRSWAIQDSNLGPLPYQRSALTD